MKSLSLRLPFPPSLNRIWRAVKGRVLLSEAAREWKAAAVNSLPRGHIAAPLEGRLIVTLLLCPPARYGKRKWDIGNREKCLADFLTEQRIWFDDEQIDVWLIVRGAATDEKGYVDILIQEY